MCYAPDTCRGKEKTDMDKGRIIAVAAGVALFVGGHFWLSSNATRAKASSLKTRQLPLNTLACRSDKLLERILKTGANGNKHAMAAMAQSAVNKGECALIKHGTTVVVEKKILAGDWRIRPVDSSTSYWTNGFMVGK